MVLEGVTVDPTRAAWRQKGGVPLPVPVSVWVWCRNGDCTQAEAKRQIHLQMRTIGVFELPALVCAHCSHPIAVTWPGLEDTMPKNTVHNGPSNNFEAPADEVTTKDLDGDPVQETAAEAELDAGLVAEPVTKPAKKAAAKKAAPKVVTGSAAITLGGVKADG